MARTLRLSISTGEVSGDLQGALLIRALRHQAEQQGIDLEITALGGDRMAAAGATLLANTLAIGSVGIFESLPYVIPTWQVQRQAKAYLRRHPPDGVVFIDYLAPNLALGQFIRKAFPQVPTTYYIAPQEWVWSAGVGNTERVVAISDQVLAVFPQEAVYYQQHGATVTYVGHPLLDQVATYPSRTAARQTLGIPPEQQAIALLPASRRQELSLLLPIMAEAAQMIQAQLPQVHYWIPLSVPQFRPVLEQVIQTYGLRATLVEGNSQTVIAAADLALTKSGTANLEIALMDVPQVVVYRLNRLTAWIARRLLNFSLPFMSPTNLVLMEPIVPEMLQEKATPEAIVDAALALLSEGDRRSQTLHDYQRMRTVLGEPGVCDRAAQAIFQRIVSKTPDSALS